MTTSTKIKTQSLEEFGSSTFKMSYVRTTDPKVTATVWPAPDRTVTSSWGRVNVPLAVFTSRIIVNSAVCERTVWGHCEAPGTSVRRRGTVGEGLARTNQGQWSPAAAGRAAPGTAHCPGERPARDAEDRRPRSHAPPPRRQPAGRGAAERQAGGDLPAPWGSCGALQSRAPPVGPDLGRDALGPRPTGRRAGLGASPSRSSPRLCSARGASPPLPPFLPSGQ